MNDERVGATIDIEQDEVKKNEMVTVGQCVIDGKAEDKLLNECKSSTVESVQGMFKKQAICQSLPSPGYVIVS